VVYIPFIFIFIIKIILEVQQRNEEKRKTKSIPPPYEVHTISIRLLYSNSTCEQNLVLDNVGHATKVAHVINVHCQTCANR
jgi:hypothetical protein